MNTEINNQRFLLGSKWRQETNPVFCVFNHSTTGNLLSQKFTDTEELPNSHSRDWKTVETTVGKIEAFKRSDWVSNVTPIPEAHSHEEAMRLAVEKYGMSPIQKTVIYR